MLVKVLDYILELVVASSSANFICFLNYEISLIGLEFYL